MSDPQSNLPDSADSADTGDNGSALSLNVSIDTLHYQANDIAELRKLSEQDPELARDVVRQRDKMDRREHVSYRIGLIVTCLLALALILGGAYIIVRIGWWQAIVFIAVMLGGGHLLRVILKGEWSETTWFGGLLSGRRTER